MLTEGYTISLIRLQDKKQKKRGQFKYTLSVTLRRKLYLNNEVENFFLKSIILADLTRWRTLKK